MNKKKADMCDKADIHFFKTGIKPVWEDPANCKGGKWIIRLKKGLSTRIWENLLMAIIGEQFLVGDELCGAVCSIRNQEDIISLWNKWVFFYFDYFPPTVTITNQWNIMNIFKNCWQNSCHQSNSRNTSSGVETPSKHCSRVQAPWWLPPWPKFVSPYNKKYFQINIKWTGNSYNFRIENITWHNFRKFFNKLFCECEKMQIKTYLFHGKLTPQKNKIFPGFQKIKKKFRLVQTFFKKFRTLGKLYLYQNVSFSSFPFLSCL